MNDVYSPVELSLGGIELRGRTLRDLEGARQRFLVDLKALDIDQYVDTMASIDARGHFIRFQVRDEFLQDCSPDYDTTQLCQTLALDTNNNSDDLEREILLAMLLGPVAFPFVSYDELMSAIRIRKNIVRNARKTALAFDTEHAERPAEYWTYSEERGFTVRPGKSLITSLEKATQPERSGKLYSFSCYRATEYVILLGIGQELANCNPDLFRQLEHQWETQAIMSGPFHDVFLHEYGSLSEPLPTKYYVPGDRLWFRNPDEHSSDVEGYEGSWVFYLGDGLFTNFWKRDQPFTLTSKCLELFHWRNATYKDQDGKLQVDDNVVDERVLQSLQNPAEVDAIVKKMLKLREPSGVYLDGGCIDATREYVRSVCPGTADIVFPTEELLK